MQTRSRRGGCDGRGVGAGAPRGSAKACPSPSMTSWRCAPSSTCRSRRTDNASPTWSRRRTWPGTNTTRRCSSSRRREAPPPGSARASASSTSLHRDRSCAGRRYGSTPSVIGIEDGRPEVIGIPLSGAPPEALTRAPERAFAYEWSPDRQEPRVPDARSDGARGGAAAAREVVHHPRGCAGLPDPSGAAEGRPAIRAPHADAADRLRRRAVVVADGCDIVYGGAVGFTAAYDARVYAVALKGCPPHHRRSRRHEHWSPLFARLGQVDRLHLDQRPQRHHAGAASRLSRRQAERHSHSSSTMRG